MKHANSNLRSLLCFETPLPNCSQQRLLKVLSMQEKYFPNEPINFECFHGLTHLRYCELAGNGLINTRSFESFISGLNFLETLDFREVDVPDIPDTIWNVKTLRHVVFRQYNSGPSADLKTLQTLDGVKSRESWNVQLPKLPNVRYLNIDVESSFLWDLFAKMLGKLKHLTHLTLVGHEVPQEIVNMQRFPFYEHFQSLILHELFPSIRNKLSPQVGMFPIHITELSLFNLQFNDDLLPVLEKLCNLRLLSLNGEQVNQKMRCSAGGFKQLHELRFNYLSNLKKWEIEEGAMPILEKVALSVCDKLGVPLGLQYLSNIKELTAFQCIKLQDHKYKIRDIFKHVPDIRFI